MQNSAESQDITIPLGVFRRRCLLFVVPLLLLAAPAIGILQTSGESLADVDEIIEHSDDQQFLVGYAYNDRNYGYLKYRRLTSLSRQSVVALGSSRVLGFREEMFSGSFYNAGYTIVSPWDFRTFLGLIPDARLPEVLILGLDQFMFNAANNRDRPPKESTVWTTKPRNDLQAACQLIPDVYKDLVRGRLPIGPVLTHATGISPSTIPVGLNGLVNAQGFRNDGSLVYGSQVRLLLKSDPAARDFHFARTLNRVKRGGTRFNHGDMVDSAAVDEIDQLLSYCRERNVQVVAFLPPYADAVWDAMQESGNYEYTLHIESALQDSFDRHECELYAFHRMSDCDSSDLEAIDGFHAGGNVYLKMLIHMLSEGSVLNKHASLVQLQHDKQHVVDRYTCYQEPTHSKSRLASAESRHVLQ